MTHHYERLSDDQLLVTELETQDPESLPGIVSEVPAGDDEPYVEFKYDLRGSGRAEEFTCVHGHHRHLAGFVMRKGEARFLVGWMCARELYGETFGAYKADYDAAVDRRRGLLRRQEVEQSLRAIVQFVEDDIGGETIREFDRCCTEIGRLPFVSDRHGREYGLRVGVAAYLLDPLLTEARTKLRDFRRSPAGGEQTLPRLRAWLPDFVSRVADLLAHLERLVDFFQPGSLQAICRSANRHDDPQRRTYEAGLMSLTCYRTGATKIVIRLSPTYRVPDRRRLNALVAAFDSIGTATVARHGGDNTATTPKEPAR